MTRTTQDDPNAAFPGLGGRTGQKRPKDETSAEYYGWLWDEQTAWAAGAGAEVQAPMAAAQPRAEYIQHMLDGRAYWNAHQQRLADAAAAREAEKAERAQAAHAQGEADKAAKAAEQEALRYVADYTGTWGLPLDIRADRRWGTKYMRLSPRQVEVLLAGKARDAQRAQAAADARDDWQAAQYEASLQRPAQAPTAAHTAKRGPSSDGMYRTADGTIWKVQKNLSGTGMYAKRLDVESRTFEYAQGAIWRLTDADRMTLEQAAEFGALYGYCCNCTRRLTNESSIAAGIGPICAGKFAA